MIQDVKLTPVQETIYILHSFSIKGDFNFFTTLLLV